MKKTGLTNFPSFLGGKTQLNKQPGDPSASLLLTSEKAVFCNTGVSKKVTNRMQLEPKNPN